MKPVSRFLATATLSLAAAGVTTTHASAAAILDEGFDDVGALIGWSQVNQSVPQGNNWFQGNPGLFAAQSGPDYSYAAANFLGAQNGSGSVDNWLITPTLALSGTTMLSFFARHEATPGFSDLLEVRFSSGSGTDPSGFGTLLATIGGSAGFPDDWTQFTTSLNVNGNGRFAFRYTGNADSLNYIGLDTVQVVSAVPEPAAWAMTVLGLGLLGLVRRQPRR